MEYATFCNLQGINLQDLPKKRYQFTVYTQTNKKLHIVIIYIYKYNFTKKIIYIYKYKNRGTREAVEGP